MDRRILKSQPLLYKVYCHCKTAKDVPVRFFTIFQQYFLKNNLDVLFEVVDHLVADQLKANIYIHVRKNISIINGQNIYV